MWGEAPAREQAPFQKGDCSLKNMKYLLLAVAILGGMSTVASAAPTMCAAGLNILNSGTTTCAIDGLTFTFDAPQFSPTSVGDALTVSSVGVTAGDVSLLFAINPGVGGFPVDVNIDYGVFSSSTNIEGIDASFPGGTDGSISEQACSIQPQAGHLCPVDDVLSSLHVTTGGTDQFGTPSTFGPVSAIYIHKDIDAVSFSEFTDSVELGLGRTTATPEPSTALMLSSTLFGLGFFCRKLRRTK
jgi:hypothetical protein